MSLIPQLGLTVADPTVVVRPVRNPEPIRTIYAAIRETSSAQPALRGFVDALRPRSARSKCSEATKARKSATKSGRGASAVDVEFDTY